MSLRRTAPVAVEPISLAEALLQVRSDEYFNSPPGGGPDSQWLTTIGIPAARDAAERFTERALALSTFEWQLERFPLCGFIEFPVAPVRSIISVRFTDQEGTDALLDPSGYELDDNIDHPKFRRAYGVSWPYARWTYDAIRVRFSAGYDDTNSPPGDPLPPMIRAAMLLTIASSFITREDVVVGAVTVSEIPQSAKALLWPYRRNLGV